MSNKIWSILYGAVALCGVWNCYHWHGVGWKAFWALYAAFYLYGIRHELEQKA